MTRKPPAQTLASAKHLQGRFRPLVDRAWVAWCQSQAVDAADKEAREAWYRAQIKLATGGKTSTKNCNIGRDFDLLMAHFEEIEGSDFEWQIKAETGDLNRLIYNLKKAGHGDYLRVNFGGNQSLKEYTLAIARSITGRPDLAGLRQLNDAQIRALTAAMVYEARRWKDRAPF